MAEQMKPSGIDWIKDIPSSWEINKVKYLATEPGTLFLDGDWIESDVIEESGIRYLTTGNVGAGFYKEQGSGYISEKTFSELHCLNVYPGDLMISRLNEPIGRSCIIPDTESRYVVAVDNVILRPNANYNKKFIMYGMNADGYAEHANMIARGATMSRISRSQLGQFWLAFPNIEEQQAIADFLDKECAQIDSVAADLEKQIALLQQYKKSLITETVTKGLDKSVPMKDSGVEGFGEIPAHWDVEPIKYRVTFHNGDRGENYPSKSELQSEGIPFINAGHLEGDGLNMDNMDYISEEKYRIMGGVKLRSGDILYCLRGSVGKNAIVDMNQGTVASSLVAIRSVRISAEYLYYCLNSYIEEVQRYLWDNGTAQPNLSADNLGKYKICIPTVEEQRTIVKYLNNICSQIDNLIIGKRKQLSTIQQHKKSLIYEYVTGKKRVKEVQ